MFRKIKYWFENYWYYYKWPVILITFFAVVILFCVVQQGTKEKADVTILYTGPNFFEVGEKETVQSNLAQILGEDYDGDGKKSVSIIDMPAFSDEEIKEAVGTSEDIRDMMQYAPYTYDEVQKNFSQQAFAGQAVICLMDPHWFSLLKENGGLAPIADILGYTPDGMVDEYGVTFSTLPVAAYCNLPEDTVICFRRLSTASAFTGKEEAERNYAVSREVLKDLFAFR